MGAVCCFAPSAAIAQPSLAPRPLLVTQALGCPRAMPVVYYATATYHISICIGQDGSWFYRGVEFANPENSINLFELSETGENAYEVTNRDVTYEINPDQLTVSQHGQIIWQEPVISWSPAETEPFR
jgi:hypothetical protein